MKSIKDEANNLWLVLPKCLSCRYEEPIAFYPYHIRGERFILWSCPKCLFPALIPIEDRWRYKGDEEKQ